MPYVTSPSPAAAGAAVHYGAGGGRPVAAQRPARRPALSAAPPARTRRGALRARPPAEGAQTAAGRGRHGPRQTQTEGGAGGRRRRREDFVKAGCALGGMGRETVR